MPYPPIFKPYINTSCFEEVLSAKTFDLKKVVAGNEYKLCIVPTLSQIVANAPATKAVIPEVLDYLRYTATIRALEHNCKFIRGAINAKTLDDFNSLTALNFDYKNGRTHCGIRSSSKRISLSPSGFHTCSLRLLEDSKQYISDFEKMLCVDKLSQIIPDFDKKMANTLKYKEQYIQYADKLINTISNDKDIFDNFIDYLSISTIRNTKSDNSNILK